MSSNIGDVPHVFQAAGAPLGLYQHLDINTTRPTSQYRSFICQRYLDWSQQTSCTLKSTSCSHSCGVMHQNCIPLNRKSHAIHSYCLKRWKSGIVHWRWAHALCHHWFILVSFQFPIILYQMADSPTMKTAVVFPVVFGLLLRHLVYSTLFWSPVIETSWLMPVPRMHLTPPLSSMSTTFFRSHIVSQADCSSFACFHPATPRRC